MKNKKLNVDFKVRDIVTIGSKIMLITEDLHAINGNDRFHTNKYDKNFSIIFSFPTLASAKNHIKELKNKGLKGVAKKPASKLKKSVACSKVLQLMDQDYSYQKALKEVLKNDKRLNKVKLEVELDKYI